MRLSFLPRLATAALAVAASWPATAQSVVVAETTAITLKASAATIADDDLVLTAEITVGLSAATVPDGTITFYDATTSRVLGWTNVARPRIAVHGLSPGRHLIEADYSGTDGYLPLVVLPSRSDPLAIDVLTRPVLTLTSQDGPATPGGLVTLVAKVIGGEGAARGTVTFRDGDRVIAADVPLDGSGRASFTTSALPEGVRSIDATYTGDAHYVPTRARIDQVVAPRIAAAE
jgi:hypothetical protein